MQYFFVFLSHPGMVSCVVMYTDCPSLLSLCCASPLEIYWRRLSCVGCSNFVVILKARNELIKLNMYSVWRSCLFILLFYYWLLVSASKSHHQANIYQKKKRLKRNELIYLLGMCMTCQYFVQSEFCINLVCLLILEINVFNYFTLYNFVTKRDCVYVRCWWNVDAAIFARG